MALLRRVLHRGVRHCGYHAALNARGRGTARLRHTKGNSQATHRYWAIYLPRMATFVVLLFSRKASSSTASPPCAPTHTSSSTAMAPKKASGHEPSKRAKEEAEWRPKHAFFPPGMNEEATARVVRLCATDFNENGATQCFYSGAHGLEPRDAQVFSCFAAVGLVPPMSLFFHAILAAYGLHLAHLHPNAMVTLAIFQHFCEVFVGVFPSVALFRHYFRPRVEEGRISGAMTWTRHQRSSPFIILEPRSKWEEWRRDWCHIRFPDVDDSLGIPAAAPEAMETWEHLDARDVELAPAIDCIKDMHELGLTGRHVVLDFVRCAVAPLQKRSHPMWLYEGPGDRTRLRGIGRDDEAIVKGLMKMIFGGEPSMSPSYSVQPLYNNSHRDEILASMPECNEFGILKTWVLPGHVQVPEPTGASSSRYAGGASSSAAAGGASSSRAAGGSGSAAAQETRRTRTLWSMADLGAGGSRRPTPPPEPSRLIELEDTDDEDTIPLAARARRGLRQPPPATSGPAPGTPAGATPAAGPAGGPTPRTSPGPRASSDPRPDPAPGTASTPGTAAAPGTTSALGTAATPGTSPALGAPLKSQPWVFQRRGKTTE